jgi:transposase
MTHVIGIDIASESFVARAISQGQLPQALGNCESFSNNSDGFASCMAWSGSLGLIPTHTLIVVEATGIYWEALALYFHQHGFSLSVVNPAQIKYYGRSVLQRGKSDELDADLIARFGASMNLRLWEPPSALNEELQVLMRQRDAYVAMWTEEKCRLHSYQRAGHPPQKAILVSKRTIAFLHQQIKDLDKNFKDTIQKDDQWQKLYDLLQTIPGVGAITAGIFLTETHALAAFHSARQLTAYVGIAPAPYTSGSSVHKKPRISKIGNSRLRQAFYMAALSSIRFNPPMRSFYHRLASQGKAKKLIVIAIARKLLVLCFAICKSLKPFDPDYLLV